MIKDERLHDLSIFGTYHKLSQTMEPVEAMAETILHTATHPDSEGRYYLSYNDGRGSQSDLFGFLEGWRRDTLFFNRWPADKTPVDAVTTAFERIADQEDKTTLTDRMYFGAHCLESALRGGKLRGTQSPLSDPAADRMLNAFSKAAGRLPEEAYSYEDSRHPHRWCGLSRGHYVAQIARGLGCAFEQANVSEATRENWDTYRGAANPKIESWARRIFSERTPEQAAEATARGKDEETVAGLMIPTLAA